MDNEKIKELEERISHLEFRQDLLFYNTPSNRILYEGNIKKEQYDSIMDLMDKYRGYIANGETPSSGIFEREMYQIIPEHHGDYHFVEYITQAFKEERRWEEVFDVLYGNSPKYRNSEEW